jgi:glutamate N-acetyltransferase / amino-acid N-acetyltransferase
MVILLRLIACHVAMWYILDVQMSAKIEQINDGGVTSPGGFSAGATYAGIKKKSKDVLDLSVLFSATACDTAAVFTRNLIKAAPVLLDRQKLEQGNRIKAVVINAGCANACTGEQGMQAAVDTAEMAAKNLGISAKEVLVASTGVIGVQLPMDKIKDGLGRIALSAEGGNDLSHAIMTTDTRPKKIAVKVKTPSTEFTIGGTCKGAGMIHPDMATMLAFLTTDAAVEPGFLNTALKKAADMSFNLVTVDGDTSTNDTLLIMANGHARNEKIDAGNCLAEPFQQALEEVCLHLAKSIARDGEGATRLIEIRVNGAVSTGDARAAARTIASSPLVKTAVHGCDPNWGRIIAAAGRSGARVEQDKSDVYISDICLLKSGMPLAFDKKTAAAELDKEEVVLRVELNLGKASALAWGCDLSEEYVVINSEYTT